MICECHGHIILDSISYAGAVERHKQEVDEAFVRRNLKICADSGIGYYRDGGDKFGVSAFARQIAWEYDIDYRTSVYIIHKNGHYGNMFGKAFKDLYEYRSLVTEALRTGADFIKVTASGMLDFKNNGAVTHPSLTEAELCEMVNIAHGEGAVVMVHANGADNIKRAVSTGADSIEHGFYMDTEAMRMLSQTNTIWVPTCVTVAGLIGLGRYDDRLLRQILDNQKVTLQEASAMGVTIACGSDSGAVGVPQGKGTLDELAILNELGIDTEPGDRAVMNKFVRQ